MAGALLDTGPLLGFLSEASEHRAWTHGQWAQIRPPMLTCEAVLTEATLLLKREGVDPDPIFTLLERGVLRFGLHLEDHQAEIRRLMRRYRDRPMSLADACLARMSELHPEAPVLTFDSDFRFYRRNGRQMIRVLMPTAE
jgi:predicted nucleic acid-binding protein